MSRPKNKDEYRAELADTFAHVLEEKGLEWQKRQCAPERHHQGLLPRLQRLLAEPHFHDEGL